MGANEPLLVIQRLRQTITKGRYGIDYTIIPRDKNNLLREKYIVDDRKVRDILNSLNTEDYISSEKSTNEDFENDTVHIFIKTVDLIKRYAGIEYTKVKLYIKLSWTKNGSVKMFIISFHEAEE